MLQLWMQQESFNGSIAYLTIVMLLKFFARKKEFMDEEIKHFQHYIHNWFQVWIQLHGLSGCTNYTHMLSSGHLAQFMFKWRNMYQFSQQGRENFNHVFSTVYFRRTNRGGRRHEGAIKSKLVGIGRWLQRRLLWMTGIADQVLNNLGDDSLLGCDDYIINTMEDNVRL